MKNEEYKSCCLNIFIKNEEVKTETEAGNRLVLFDKYLNIFS